MHRNKNINKNEKSEHFTVFGTHLHLSFQSERITLLFPVQNGILTSPAITGTATRVQNMTQTKVQPAAIHKDTFLFPQLQ